MNRFSPLNTPLYDADDSSERDWLLAPLALFLVALQMTWFAQLRLGGAHLDLPLLGVVSVGLLRSWRTGAAYGLATGLLCGWISGANVGTWGLTHLLVGGVCGTFGLRFEANNPLAAPLCASMGILACKLLFYIMSPGDFSGLTPGAFMVLLLGAVVLHALLAPFVQWGVSRLLVRPENMMFGARRF